MACVLTLQQSLLSERFQMFLVEVIRFGDEFFVPIVPPSSLVTTDQPDRVTSKVKCKLQFTLHDVATE